MRGQSADHAAGNMGVNSSSLKRSFPAEVEALKARWFEYLRHLNDMQNPTAAPTAAQMMPRHDRQVLKDEAGYPIMPPEPPATIHQSNKDLQRILRTYLNEHYRKWDILLHPHCADILQTKQLDTNKIGCLLKRSQVKLIRTSIPNTSLPDSSLETLLIWSAEKS